MYQSSPARPSGYRPPHKRTPPNDWPDRSRRSADSWAGERWVRVPPQPTDYGDGLASTSAQFGYGQSPFAGEPSARPVAESSPPPEPTSPLDLMVTTVREGLQVLLPALLLAAVIHGFFAQATVVYGQSMEPSLHERERLIIDKISYRMRVPERGDIVVIDLPHLEEKLVKRIVGLPGETIEIRDGLVYINGDMLAENFPHATARQTMPPTRLAPLQYYVLGDNRSNSNDSRAFGSIHRESIIGRVWLRYWPLLEFGQFP